MNNVLLLQRSRSPRPQCLFNLHASLKQSTTRHGQQPSHGGGGAALQEQAGVDADKAMRDIRER